MTARPTLTWPALGTTVQLAVLDVARLSRARQFAASLIDEVDGACSRFRADSDLTRANAAAGAWVRVSPLLASAVGAALAVARWTEGLVDPALGRALAAAGYDRDLADVRAGRVDPASVVLPPAPPRPGAWREVEVDPDGALKVPPGVALDLGATGKAFAADLVATRVAEQTGTGVVVSLGGDVAVAGHPPEEPDGVGWAVTIEAAAGTGAAQTVLLPDGGIATSSIRRRTWRHDGVLVQHLLDPRSGVPVQPVWQEVTVRGVSCLQANAASTAAMVMGGPGAEWLRERRLPSMLVQPHGAWVGTCGWPGGKASPGQPETTDSWAGRNAS